MVQREESRRKLMNPQVTSEPESQAFATTNRHRDASGGTRGASSARCDNCKKEICDNCDNRCDNYPELRPKHRDKGGDRKGSRFDKGDRAEQKGRSGGLSATLEDPTQIEQAYASGRDDRQANQAQLSNLT
jgi:hypothetical protein